MTQKPVLLIGCGPGEKKYLTLEAYELIQTLDVALVDGFVTDEVRGLLPISCLVIDVTKKKGTHSVTQERINTLLLEHAKEGKQVGRLKGGDVSVFARTAEEASFLSQHGFSVRIVSGLSSSLFACNASGIMPTVRTLSSSFTVVSAHLRESRFNSDWIELLHRQNHTVIVLMAYSFAARIQEAIMRANVNPNTPAAYVSHAGLPSQKTVIGTVSHLEQLAALCAKPAILIIGESIASHEHLPFLGEKIVL